MRRARLALASGRRQSELTHEAGNPFPTARNPLLMQGSMDPWAAIDRTPLCESMFDDAGQLCILLMPPTRLPLFPRIIATLRHLQHPTQRDNGIVTPLLLNELILPIGSCVKMANTFFGMSRS